MKKNKTNSKRKGYRKDEYKGPKYKKSLSTRDSNPLSQRRTCKQKNSKSSCTTEGTDEHVTARNGKRNRSCNLLEQRVGLLRE